MELELYWYKIEKPRRPFFWYGTYETTYVRARSIMEAWGHYLLAGGVKTSGTVIRTYNEHDQMGEGTTIFEVLQ